MATVPGGFWFRARDIVVAAVGLVVFSPVLAVTSVMVRFSLGRPVLFRQLRPGLHGRPFTLVKFRTMLPPDPECGRVSDAERITPLGRFLRSTSLDELPSLVNVLRGDLSLVGPRPLLMCYLDRYTHEQARRHDVPPGLTGWAQTHGRNAASWDEKLAMDVWYARHRTHRLDAQILLRTMPVVLRRVGIAARGHVTAPEFVGTAVHDACH